jgi:hypothetical protein
MVPILASLSLLLTFCGGASAQAVEPKPAGFPPEAEQWIRDHARAWEKGGELAARVSGKNAFVLVAPPRSEPALRCLQALLAREDPLLLCLPAGWDEVRPLDSWLAEGKGTPPALLEKPLLELARAWNADEKHARKLRAAGIDYRPTQALAIGLAEFIVRVDPESSDRVVQLLGPFRQLGADGKNRYDKVDENWRSAVQKMLADLHGQAAERREEWGKQVGPQALADGLRSLERLRQAEEEVSQPADFRRARALCANAAEARAELAPGAGVLLLLPPDAGLELRDAHGELGAQMLVLLVLQAKDDPDLAALARVQPSGMLDLRELPKSGPVEKVFAEHLGKRADLVLWGGAP